MTRPSDAGFTLIELLLCIIIISILAVPLAEAAGQVLNVSLGTAKSLGETGRVRVLSADLRADIQDANAVGNNATLSEDGASSCVWPDETGNSVILWTNDSDTSTVARYYAGPDPGTSPAENRLFRLTCVGGTGPDALSGDDPRVLETWPATNDPVVTCDSGAECGGSTVLHDNIAASDGSLTVDDATGFPTTAPFEITVGGEITIVTDIPSSDTFTVSRSSPASHDAGATVTYVPSLVSICLPLGGVNCADTPTVDGPFSLTVARRQT